MGSIDLYRKSQLKNNPTIRMIKLEAEITVASSSFRRKIHIVVAIPDA